MSQANKESEKISRRQFLQRFRQIPGLEEKETEVEAEKDDNVSAASRALDRLKDLGVSVHTLSQDNDLLEIQAKSLREAFGDKQAKLLEPLAHQVIRLDLGNTVVTDKGMAIVGQMERLERLYLQNTAVTDAGLEPLSQLQELKYLNLYGTEISDKGLTHLEACKSLHTLYVWQTNITEEGVDRLKKTLPDLEVTFGTSFFDSTDQSYDLL